jgi:hypothetical protein
VNDDKSHRKAKKAFMADLDAKKEIVMERHILITFPKDTDHSNHPGRYSLDNRIYRWLQHGGVPK